MAAHLLLNANPSRDAHVRLRRLSHSLNESWLARPRVQLGSVLLALLLMSPCLATRMVLDDHVLAVKAGVGDAVAGLPVDRLGLFTFTTGDPQRNQLLIDEGVLLPWWTEPRHLNAFFRPLSALTHLLDFQLWPASSALMHAHSLLWFALLLIVLAHVYRRIESSAPALCGFALLLYALDDAHGATVGWISNRNAIVSACLALPALAYHHRWATERYRPGAWLAPAWLLLGLCAGETAVCVIGYLAAYACCLDPRSGRARVLSLLPCVTLLLVHRALYHALGLGSFGSAGYHDPLREPIAFARMLGYNLPVLLSAELFVPVADLAFFGDVRGRGALWCWCVATLLGLGWLCWKVLRRDAHARFWALGMLLAAVPVSASVPGERLLLALGFGGAALLARLLAALWEARRIASPARRIATDALLALHLIAAPLTLPVRAYALEPIARAIDRLDASLPRSPAVRSQSVIILNAPLDILASYLQVARAARRVPRPARIYWLSSSSSETRVTRLDARTLRVEQARGFLLRPEETHYRADVSGLAESARVTLSALQARVVHVLPDGRPQAVEFAFGEALESEHYLFRVYRDGELVPWQIPAAGGGVSLPAHDFFRLVAAEVLR
jgi:hypothetical protein